MQQPDLCSRLPPKCISHDLVTVTCLASKVVVSELFKNAVFSCVNQATAPRLPAAVSIYGSVCTCCEPIQAFGVLYRCTRGVEHACEDGNASSAALTLVPVERFKKQVKYISQLDLVLCRRGPRGMARMCLQTQRAQRKSCHCPCTPR